VQNIFVMRVRGCLLTQVVSEFIRNTKIFLPQPQKLKVKIYLIKTYQIYRNLEFKLMEHFGGRGELEAVRCFETLVCYHITTRSHYPEDSDLNTKA